MQAQPNEVTPAGPPAPFGRPQYLSSLKKFDAAICEANAVSQASANRMAAPNVGYASRVFTRMCCSGVSFVRAAPLSRWTHADFDDWQFGAVAGHARSLLDGYLLFSYLIEPAGSDDELHTRINVMYLNDCTRRIKLHQALGLLEDMPRFEEQREELRGRLMRSEYFTKLPIPVQKNCLNGQFLMVSTRDQMLEKVNFPKGHFDGLYDLWSQHVHILPMSFERMEPDGRGTGTENEVDRAYIGQAMTIGAAILEEVTDAMVEQFPDVADVRKGVRSTFHPGPVSNKPRKRGPTYKVPPVPPQPQASALSEAIIKGLGSTS